MEITDEEVCAYVLGKLIESRRTNIPLEKEETEWLKNFLEHSGKLPNAQY